MSDPVEKILHFAAEKGRVSEVSSVLRDHPEINVNRTNEYQWTPLHAAAFNGRVEVVKLLLAHPDINVNMKNIYGATCLSLSCLNDSVSVVRMLLEDPRVDVTLDNKGRTPVWWASLYGQYEVIERLVASGRDLGDIKNKTGKWWGKYYTALEIARACERNEIVS